MLMKKKMQIYENCWVITRCYYYVGACHWRDGRIHYGKLGHSLQCP